MRKLLLTAALSMSLMIVGCAAKPHARSAASTASDGAATGSPATAGKTVAPLPPAVAKASPSDPNNKVIVHIVSQHQTITVTSSPKGLLYSLADPNGHLQIAEATPEKFAELQPELYRQIQHYIAVHADDAPIPAAESADVDASIRTGGDASRRSFRGSTSGVNSDSFNRTADRPFPTAREDAPQ